MLLESFVFLWKIHMSIKAECDFEKFIILTCTVNTFVFDLGNQLLCNYNDNFIVGNKMKNTLQTY